MEPTLYIVGAGPGDPDLISVKGARLLSQADVVLYDALVSAELLAGVLPKCKLIFVGKRKGVKAFPQEEINQLLVFYATRFRCVVRLKGGDPHVFGRGHEELEYAARHGVQTAVIPGISSAVAGPSAAGIPLTKRGVNESFWVLTGTVSSGAVASEMHLAAQSSATVVVLMGITQIKEIMRLFIQFRSPWEPVAVIEQATTPNQRVHTGTTGDIVSRIGDQITTPAIIVIGMVVKEREQLQSLYSIPDCRITEKVRSGHVIAN